MMRTACLSREQLLDYSLGRVSADEEERIAEHLEQCESCQQAAAECDRSADSLVAALRLPDEALSADDVHCDAALARAKQPAAGPADARHERTEPIRLREYELLRKLGEGGMGTVYLARHTRLDRIVALKILPPDRMRDSSAVARFAREMRAVGGLDHPAIVRATDAGDIDGTHFLVMEYVEGLDLASLVERLGPIGIADACELVRQAALGLQHVHERGMVHRDIKPSNLMLTPRGEVKILDLGLALLQRGDGELQGITTIGRFMGTLDYMPPEQADDSHEVDIRADIYGLGATLYRLICGVPPFAGKEYRSPLKKLKALAIEPVRPIRERRPEVPAGLAQVIERMLAKEPEARFATPAEVAEALGPFTAGSDLAQLHRDAESRQLAPQADSSLAEQVKDSRQSGPGLERTKRSRWFLAVLLLALAVLVAAAAIYVETDRGTLVIKSPDPGIEVLIRRNEKPVDDWELQRGENRTTVRSGSYEIVLIGASDGLRVRDGTFTLTRGDEHVATVERITQREKSADSAQDVPAIRQRREPFPAAAAASDRQALQGTWEVVSGDASGEPGGPGDEVQRWLKVRFGPNEFVIWGGQSVEAKGPWMLHPAEQPQTIILSSIHSRGSADREIYWARYELKGDELRLAISDQKSPADFRPDKDTAALWLRRTKGSDESRPETPQSAVEVKIFSFVNADAAEAANIARQLMPEDRVHIATDARTNSLVIQGSAKDLETLTAIFLRLDEKARSAAEAKTGTEGQNAANMLLEALAGASDRLWNILGLKVARAAPHELGSQSPYAAGAAVTEVRPSSPAASAGIRVGDVLVELGSSMVAAPDELDSVIKGTVLQGHYALRYKLLRAGDPRQGVMEFPDNPLQGVWEFEGLQDGGRSAPAEVLKSLKLILTEERFQFWEKGRIDKQGTYELDPSADPKTITFYEAGSGKPTRGIYRREDDKLWITLNETPGGERPSAFVSERGSPNDTLMELRRTEEPVPPIESGEESERTEKDTAQPARRAQTITSEAPSSLDKTSDRISFNFENAPWPDVLKLLGQKAGLTLDLRDVPPGEFTYTDPKQYTPTEALGVLNGYLIARGYVLVRRDSFLVSLQIGNVPENLIPTVTIDELPQRGRNELLNVIFPLEGVKAEDWVDEVRNALDVVGSKGQVAVLERSNAIAVTDFGGNLRRVHGLLGDVLARPGRDESTEKSLQPANAFGLSLRPATPREIGSQTKYRGGLAIEQVPPSSPASAAGIRIGDVLVGLGEWETATIDDVHSALQWATAANLRSLKFYILRDGETVYGTLTIPDASADDAPAAASAPADRDLGGREDTADRAGRERPLALEREGRRYVVDFEELTVSAIDVATNSVLWRTTVSQLRERGDWHLELFLDELLELRRFTPDRDTRVTLNALTGAIVDSGSSSSAEARQTISNLRALAMAMNEYQKRAEHPWLPPAVVLGPDGKTPHSWRIELLPFLGHTELFQEYRLDEPWNSEHNLKLLDKMPAVFRHPNDPPTSADTPYQVVTDDWRLDRSPVVDPSGNVGLPMPRVSTLFSSAPQREGLRMQDIIDGTANMLLIIERKRRVPWTQPEDIPHSELAKLQLGGIWYGGFYAALADTTVKFLPADIEPEMLRRLVAPTDGEAIDWDSLRVTPPGHKRAAAPGGESRKDDPPGDHADEQNAQGQPNTQANNDGRVAAAPGEPAAEAAAADAVPEPTYHSIR